MADLTIIAAGNNRVLNVRPDAPDLRDRYYEPALIPLNKDLDNSKPDLVLDQGQEGACTGFGLAAVINFLRYRRDEQIPQTGQSLPAKHQNVSILQGTLHTLMMASSRIRVTIGATLMIFNSPSIVYENLPMKEP